MCCERNSRAGLKWAVWLAIAASLPGAAGEPTVHFENVAKAWGLTEPIPNGGDTEKRFIIETTGSGAGLVDVDNDGWLDAILVSGEGAPSRLYRNKNGRFVEIEGAFAESGWGQGVCAGDFDGDGWTDILITYWGKLALYRNLSGEGFANVAAEVGLAQQRPRYNTGCAFLDYDRDGRLDLFVANYLQFDFETTPGPGATPYCFYREMAVNCGPRGLPFDRNILYRQQEDGTFRDVSHESGIAAADQSYSLGVLVTDVDGDGWPDIYVASDRTPSLLYRNQGNGKFSEEGLLRGAALDENGKALSGMGITGGDFDGDGAVDLFRTNFSDERVTLYRNRGDGDFDEATLQAGLGHATRYVGWGCGFLDFDNDGIADLFQVNGHVFPEVDRLGIDIRYRQPALLYKGTGSGQFEDVSPRAGPAFAERKSSRGAAFGDIDNDGTVEILVNSQNAVPSLFKQTTRPPGNWVLVKVLREDGSDAIGARIAMSAGGRTQFQEIRSGGSYLSQNDLRAHFGLGNAERIERVEVHWPAGGIQVWKDLEVNRLHTLRKAGD